jgi:hypothetical protein
MKKIYLSFCAIAFAGVSFAQTISNPGMETWRSGTAGTAPVVPIEAPTDWYGFDSLVIAYGQSFGWVIGAGTDWKAQLFEETAIKYSGAKSAKMITLKQDTLGYFAGMLSNAKVDLDMGAIIAGADPMTAITYSGGTPVTLRINSVSAWVEYFPGIDTATGMMGGLDSGLLTVQAISTYGGQDSVIGAGYATIPPCSAFTQITANVIYADTFYTTDLVRIIFMSSGGASQNLDSSTLYVDDVTMTGTPQTGKLGSTTISSQKETVKVYPNPSSDVLYFEGGEGLQLSIFSVSGQTNIVTTLSRNPVNTSVLPSGLYFYSLSNADGYIVQRGKVVVEHK